MGFYTPTFTSCSILWETSFRTQFSSKKDLRQKHTSYIRKYYSNLSIKMKSKIDKKKGNTYEENQNVDHLTKVIGVFGLFHAMVYTAIGLSIIINVSSVVEF